MTEAQTIPEDIMKKAIEVAQVVCRNLDYDDVSYEVREIAHALLAERDFCAALLDSCEIKLIEYPSEIAAEYYQAGATDALIAAADAIRKGGA